MDKEFNILFKEFDKVRQKGFIKALTTNSSAIGLTFEKELNIPRNEFCIPDFHGIEIKTKSEFSKSNINLFSAVPDGENLFEIERLKNSYGYPYPKDKRFKVLRFVASGKHFTSAGLYKYKLEIDRQDKKIYLCISNQYFLPIEKTVYWSFDYLESRLNLKLKYLAIIKAKNKRFNGWNYFHYNKINFYEMKDFNTFLDLLEKGIILLIFNVGIHLDEKRYGKTCNHGCSFTINEKNITLLYNTYEINNHKKD